jgi:hypothetical protein
MYSCVLMQLLHVSACVLVVSVDYNEGLHQTNRSHSAFFQVARSSGVVAHIPVNVSHIVCHGQTGHGIEMTDMQVIY